MANEGLALEDAAPQSFEYYVTGTSAVPLNQPRFLSIFFSESSTIIFLGKDTVIIYYTYN